MTSVLGKQIVYPDKYSPDILIAVDRSLGRSKLEYNVDKYAGEDIWTLFELSHLDLNGVPKNYIGVLSYSHKSKAIVESKSLKLYLNGFNNCKISVDDYYQFLVSDISKILQTRVALQLFQLGQVATLTTRNQNFNCLDSIEDFNANLPLKKITIEDEQLLYTDAFRSRCPVTGQPDWASIYFSIDGKFGVEPKSLLSHIISFRDHQAFHEQCIEELLCDLVALAPRSSISIFARFTRRGGIDINPYRFYSKESVVMKKLIQQSKGLEFRHSRQ